MQYKISLTDFIEVVHRSGTPRATMARNILERTDYHPYQDYYKPLREQIIEVHRKSSSKSELRNLLASTSTKKQNNYKRLIDAYCSWWGYKKPTWFKPPRSSYTHANITVNINPELGLSFNGSDHVIKLYFKSRKLSKQKADLISGLMSMKLKTKAKICVLDILERKLFVPTIQIPGLKQAVDAELAYLSAFTS